MCGIAGVFDPTRHPTADDVAPMSSCLTHRGPDADGVFVDGPVALAHRRLAIIDPDGGDQPMTNEDGDVVVVFNGEIYNYRSLRSSLSATGHRFTSDADTEVLVHGYEEYGLDVFDRVDGLFAVGIWDANAERTVLARDPVGIKPLVYARDGDRLWFGSEVSSLLAADCDHGGIDPAGVAQYFTFGFVPSPGTIFEGFARLRPGTVLVADADGVSRESFGEFRPSARNPSLDAAASTLRERVTEAVDRRLMSDVPLGAFLSGGIDSSIVVGVMADLLEDPVKTFTVGFEESVFDESWAAREVADYNDTDHTEVTVSAADVRETIPAVLDGLGEPFADPSLIPTYVVARETARDVTVALSGDGADELFAGYEKYRGEHLSQYYRAVPGPVRNAMESLADRLPVSRGSRAGEGVRKLRAFTDTAGESDPVDRHLGWLRTTDVASRDRALAVDVDAATRPRETLATHHEAVRDWLPATRQSTMEQQLAVDTGFVLPDQILRKADRASMANSLEVRVPFLDTSVVEYAFSLPLKHRITARSRKRVLRRAFDDVLPDAILDRGKRGFDMPIGEWLKGPLAGEFRRTLSEGRFEYLDADGVAEIFEEHRVGEADHERFLWSVYVYARWRRRLHEAGHLG